MFPLQSDTTYQSLNFGSYFLFRTIRYSYGSMDIQVSEVEMHRMLRHTVTINEG